MRKNKKFFPFTIHKPYSFFHKIMSTTPSDPSQHGIYLSLSNIGNIHCKSPCSTCPTAPPSDGEQPPSDTPQTPAELDNLLRDRLPTEQYQEYLLNRSFLDTSVLSEVQAWVENGQSTSDPRAGFFSQWNNCYQAAIEYNNNPLSLFSCLRTDNFGWCIVDRVPPGFAFECLWTCIQCDALP